MTTIYMPPIPEGGIVPYTSTTSFPNTAVIAPTKPVYRKKQSAWFKAMRKLYGKTQTIEETEKFYRSVDIADVIDVLGNMRLFYGGVPKKYVALLLEGTTKNVKRDKLGCFMLKGTGLMYKRPCIVGKTAASFNTSLTGILLLEHWARKNRRFRKFFEAYKNNKKVSQIKSECVDFEMGVLPAVFTEAIKKHEEKLEIVKKRNSDELARLQAMQQASAMYQQARSLLWGSSNTTTTSNTLLGGILGGTV